MMNRSLSIATALGVLVAASLSSPPASALPSVGSTAAQTAPALMLRTGSKYYRRYDPQSGTYVRAPFTEVDTRRGTWVAAPFARVYSGRHGTWVRAPFVNLWVPR